MKKPSVYFIIKRVKTVHSFGVFENRNKIIFLFSTQTSSHTFVLDNIYCNFITICIRNVRK